MTKLGDLGGDRKSVVLLALIFVMGIVAAVVSFGLLDSQAKVDTPYSISGAIAGAVISWGVLTSVYLQIRRSTDEWQALQRHVNELQNKVMRGSPRPANFIPEVDERQGIVLARPSDWDPRGGVMFDFQSRRETEEDLFPAVFRASFVPIPSSAGGESTTDRYYQQMQEIEEQLFTSAYSAEIIHLGDPPGGLRSLRSLGRGYARVWLQTDPSGQREWDWLPATQQEFVAHVRSSVDAGIRAIVPPAGNGLERETIISQWRDELVPYYLQELDSGACNPAHGLVAEVEHHLAEQDAPRPPTTSSPAPESTATETARRGARPVGQAARQDGSPDSTTPVSLMEVVPISRIRVICRHPRLERDFLFELIDNVPDFVESSESFNQIIASVRFLD